jgi:hypothetical protein
VRSDSAAVRQEWDLPDAERRRARRFTAEDMPVRLALIEGAGGMFRARELSVFDISARGLCARAPLALEPGYVGQVAMALLAPNFSLIFATIRVVWSRCDAGGCLIGAEFLESTSGLFGPS